MNDGKEAFDKKTIIINITEVDNRQSLEDDREAVLEAAAKCLKNGGLVAFPTETVYGLGADGLNPEASGKIYAAKGRPSDNPLIVHIADMDALEKLAYTNEKAHTLAHAFWPGPLTLVLPKRDVVPDTTTGGLGTVAVRMPAHPAALTLIRQSGVYVAAPSANISGRPSPTKAEHVIEDMSGRVDYIIDGGPVGIGIESTIVDLSGEVPTILRPGYITKRMLEEMIGEVALDPALEKPLEMEAKGIRPKAPGMKYTHYAPKGELTLVEPDVKKWGSMSGDGADGSQTQDATRAVITKIRELAREKMNAGYKVGIMAPAETLAEYEGYADLVVCVGDRNEKTTVAAGLYAALRDFDDAGAQYIYAESFRGDGLSYAIMNRLLKAAGQRVIQV